VRIGRFVTIPPPAEETIDLTCDECERKRRERVLKVPRDPIMTEPLYSTLDALQRACVESVFAQPLPEGAAGAGICRSPTSDERFACDLIVGEGVKWLADKKPPKTRKARDRMFEEVTQQAESAVCGFGFVFFIGEIIFSWLIRRALDWLWNWFKETKEAPVLICGMMTRPAGA
jgi:hypothetical protein